MPSETTRLSVATWPINASGLAIGEEDQYGWSMSTVSMRVHGPLPCDGGDCAVIVVTLTIAMNLSTSMLSPHLPHCIPLVVLMRSYSRTIVVALDIVEVRFGANHTDFNVWLRRITIV